MEYLTRGRRPPGRETGRETGREKREGRHHLHGVGLLVRTSGAMLLVREGGVEPPRPFGHWNLNPARLPIPPPAHWVCSGPSHFSVGAPGDIRRLARRRPWIHIRCFDSARGDQGDQGEGVTGGRTGVGRSEGEPEAGEKEGLRGRRSRPGGRRAGRGSRSGAGAGRRETERREAGRAGGRRARTDRGRIADRGRTENGRRANTRDGQERAESRTPGTDRGGWRAGQGAAGRKRGTGNSGRNADGPPAPRTAPPTSTAGCGTLSTGRLYDPWGQPVRGDTRPQGREGEPADFPTRGYDQ